MFTDHHPVIVEGKGRKSSAMVPDSVSSSTHLYGGMSDKLTPGQLAPDDLPPIFRLDSGKKNKE